MEHSGLFTSAPTWMLQCERELWISGGGFAGILCKLSCLHAYKATSQAGKIVYSCPVAFQLHTHLLFANRKSENDCWSHLLFSDLTRHNGRYGGIINHICFLFLEEARLYKIKQHCVCVCMRSQSLHSVQLLAALWTVAPPRFLCPWDFPGKNTGVGCHFFFQVILLT